MGWFGRKSDKVTISRKEWDDLNADVRGLKRLAELEARETQAQNERFASAIDQLERRIALVGDAGGNNVSALSQRIARVGERVGVLELASGMIKVEGTVG